MRSGCRKKFCNCDPICCSLISRMLQRAPESRASLDDIVYDPWLDCTAVGGGDTEGNAIPMDEQLPLVARYAMGRQ